MNKLIIHEGRTTRMKLSPNDGQQWSSSSKTYVNVFVNGVAIIWITLREQFSVRKLHIQDIESIISTTIKRGPSKTLMVFQKRKLLI